MMRSARALPARPGRAGVVLFLLCVLSTPSPGSGTARAAAAQSVVTGSVVAGKASLGDVLIYTFVNCRPLASTFSYAVALPPQLNQTGGAPPSGSLTVPAFSYATIQLVVHVLHGTPPGFQAAPLNWANVTTLETGVATAAIQTRPFDENSPTLHSSPNPRLLTLGPASVTTVAGCSQDTATVSARWRIIEDDDPFLYTTTVTNPAPGGGAMVTVTNPTGALPVPAGPPATILQTIAPPVTPEPILVNEVTVTLDAQTPGGPIHGVAVSRYTVIFFSPGPVVAPSQRWSEIKRLYAP